MFAVAGLLLAILDFTDKTGVLERDLDTATVYFMQITHDLTIRFNRFIAYCNDNYTWDRLKQSRHFAYIITVGSILLLVFYFPIMFTLFVLAFVFCACWVVILLLKLLAFIIHWLNYPKKGIVGSLGLLLALIGLFI
jgi:hypothetical protein